MHRSRTRNRADYRRTIRLIAVITNADTLAFCKVHTVDMLEEAVDKVLSELLTVADNINSRHLLFLEHDECGVAFALLKCLTRKLPGRPKPLWFRKPSWLGKTAGDGSR